MEKHIQTFLNKISYLSITIATLTLILLLLFQPPPDTCINPKLNPNHKPHPKSSCAAAHRPLTTIHRKNHRLWSTNTWRKSVDSFSAIFHYLQTLDLISNHTHALILSAGGGHAVMALNEIGLRDVTGVELVDSPPLVSRADPHNLPFFDSVFDLGFSACLDQALFPVRYVREMERTVRVGGVVVVCVEVCENSGVMEVLKVFRRSVLLQARNVTLMGSKMTMIVTKRIESMFLPKWVRAVISHFRKEKKHQMKSQLSAFFTYLQDHGVAQQPCQQLNISIVRNMISSGDHDL